MFMHAAGQVDLGDVACSLDPYDLVHVDQHHVFVDPYRYALQVGLTLAQCVQCLQDLRGRLRAGAGGS
ncbi:hypothetical protein QE424_001549 [Stenotrophomonas rhizophila]|uniref:Uncharacterized protein n=1 Tax=Stenotrophomonas rhizophila TaxID=216778 RepID=A0AAP5AJ21_9GAMM|nr:hypothetical protein [Stenotrophomonas rhizophila]MDQ1108390.1 hypothetical protein [Stenotrophomonas rhizophila]